MEDIKKLLDANEFQQAYECLQVQKERNDTYYIYSAYIMEKLSKLDEAFQIALEGYEKNPNNYELVFMIGNYELLRGNYESAYVWYLLSLSLCETQDKQILLEQSAQIDTSCLNGCKVRELLYTLIKERCEKQEFQKTYRFVSDVVFSLDPFLFHKIIDEKLCRYQMMLEITICEAKRMCDSYTAYKYADGVDFENILQEFKFAFRRIWFDFPEKEQELLRKLLQKYDVSAEFLVGVGKCAVQEWYVSAVLLKTAELLRTAGESEKAAIVQTYGEWLKTVLSVNEDIPVIKREKNHMQVYHVDAQHQTEEPDRISSSEDISYILCSNDDRYLEEVLLYLSYQKVPEDQTMSVYVVHHAKSMTQGYNAGMRASHAAYKIYIHQDTFIFEPMYTAGLIEMLQTDQYQMLGIAGTAKMPEHGVWWDSSANEKHLCLYQDMILYILRSITDEKVQDNIPVQCLDGVLIATSKDLAWREDLFTNFHFYDVSQGMEFQKAGYRVGMYNNAGKAGVLHEVYVGKEPEKEYAYESMREKFCDSYNFMNQ
jgi:tetratricopeptide (TPR) repeat protein